VQKFNSDTERKLAMILDRDAVKRFKPAGGQFLIFYRIGADYLEYQPDFVAETSERIYMLEPMARNQIADAVVLAKRDAAVKWCANASDHARNNGEKPWRGLLIPLDEIAGNIALEVLAASFG
jgi:type III restriction enzyme